MVRLQAGTLPNLASDSLAGAMDAAFVTVWNSRKDTDLPDDPRAVEDRQMLFVAVARGTLDYLYRHRNDIGTTLETAGGASSEHDHQLEFDWE